MVPKEVRCIVFDERDTRLAASMFLSSRGDRVTAAEIEGIELTQDADGPAGQIRFAADLARETVTLAGAQLLSAVLLFCSRRRIPLPHTGAKSLELADADLVLVITTTLSAARGTTRPPADDAAMRRKALRLVR
jgi:hypothetical protein